MEDCEHIVGREYDGDLCGRIINNIDEVLGVALVSRPAQPDARIVSLSVTTQDLREALPAEWRPGTPVNCDKCLLECPGIHEVDFTAIHDEQTDSADGSELLHSRVRLA
jgi:hypothetical protein